MRKPKNPKKGEIWDVNKKMYFYDGEDWVDITVMKEAFLEVVAGMAVKWIRKEVKKIIDEGKDLDGD